MTGTPLFTTIVRSASLLLFISSSIVTVVNGTSPWLFLAGVVGMFGAMLMCTRFCTTRKTLVAAVSVAVLVRILFIATFPPSDDVNRYVWEGRIQLHGFNPFTVAPDSPQATHLRDDIWKGINHKEITTIYWPFAQILFRATAFFAPEPIGFKVLMTLFDIATIVVLLLIASKQRFLYRHVLLYALNPLIIVCIAGQGHIESVVVFLVVCGIALARGKYKGIAYTVLGCAVLTKVYVLILVPLFIRKIGLRPILFLCAPLMLVIPYWTTPSAYIATPLLFTNDFAFNGPLFTLLTHTGGLARQPALIALAAVLILGSTMIFFITPSLVKSCGMVLGLMVLCLPTIHPWYLLLLTPHLVFFRQWSWLTLHGTVFFMMFYFDPAVTGSLFHDQHLLMLLEYLPFAVVFLTELFIRRTPWPVRYAAPQRLSVIIPVRNEEQQIAACIQSVTDQKTATDVIVVDGGSEDATMEIAGKIPGVTVVQSRPGRGVQIAAGITRAQGDVIVVLHADSRLMPGSLKQVIDVLSDNPESAGGSMGAQYNTSESRFRFTSMLNRMRAQYTGISFGDQAQFFRTEALPEGFPDYMLMEDVELSMRLKEHGTTVIIPSGVISSSRRWIQYGYLNNFITVISLTSLFLVLRAFGMIHDKGEWFRTMYYGKKQS